MEWVLTIWSIIHISDLINTQSSSLVNHIVAQANIVNRLSPDIGGIHAKRFSFEADAVGRDNDRVRSKQLSTALGIQLKVG